MSLVSKSLISTLSKQRPLQCLASNHIIRFYSTEAEEKPRKSAKRLIKKLKARRVVKAKKSTPSEPRPLERLTIKPNKVSNNWLEDHLKPGLMESDITAVSAQYSFDPNAFYDNVESSLPSLSQVQSVLRKKRDLFSEAELEALENSFRTQLALSKKGDVKGAAQARRALVDQPHMKKLIQLSIERDTPQNVERKTKTSGNLVFVTLIRSHNHQMRVVKKSVHQLGLRKIHQTQVHADSPRVRGFIYTCRHLLHVQIVPVSAIFPDGVPPEDVLPEHLRTKPRTTMVERQIARTERRRVNKRDYSAVEQKYAHLQKSEQVLKSVPQQV